MSVRTRFAPSPTGLLHIGNARAALFNYLFARHHGGAFLLRIEDTDRERSTQHAVDVIFDGLSWMGLTADEPPVYQSSRQRRHAEVAYALLEAGHAYRCYCTADELRAMRERAIAEGRAPRYDGRWRDRDPADAPAGVAPVIRLKAPRAGETVVEDLVQGPVRVANAELDDMIILRSDGSPTYLHAVVVDDHDMAISHVIRGDDHLTNSFRQSQIYAAMGWERPRFAHLPLIHGPDGAKLSKRHGAQSVVEFRDQGILPEALNNYLLRLGWGHGDAEVLSREQQIALFDLDGVGRSASRMDYVKLAHLNGVWLRQADDARLTDDVLARLRLASLQWQTGHHPDAVATWQSVADDGAAPRLLRDLATLTSAQHQLDSGDPILLKQRLEVLTSQDNPWRPMAQQVIALLDIRTGHLHEAASLIQRITLDPTAPQDMRQMAGDLLSTLPPDALAAPKPAGAAATPAAAAATSSLPQPGAPARQHPSGAPTSAQAPGSAAPRSAPRTPAHG